MDRETMFRVVPVRTEGTEEASKLQYFWRGSAGREEIVKTIIPTEELAIVATVLVSLGIPRPAPATTPSLALPES